MKNYLRLGILLLAVSLSSCGDGETDSSDKEEKVIVNPNNPNNPNKSTSTETDKEEAKETPASERIDLENKGVGPVKSVTIAEKIDPELAKKGQELYEGKCTACHKPDKKFVGPAPKDILKRRSPEWVMNMILNPDVMTKEDPLAKDLFIEYNGAIMTNQGLSEDEARAILEYIRTL